MLRSSGQLQNGARDQPTDHRQGTFGAGIMMGQAGLKTPFATARILFTDAPVWAGIADVKIGSPPEGAC